MLYVLNISKKFLIVRSGEIEKNEPLFSLPPFKIFASNKLLHDERNEEMIFKYYIILQYVLNLIFSIQNNIKKEVLNSSI